MDTNVMTENSSCPRESIIKRGKTNRSSRKRYRKMPLINERIFSGHYYVLNSVLGYVGNLRINKMWFLHSRDI